ncbi:MAG: bifunctional 2-polyprenyl-6-hydroxyphenol methylase/3-demethylubiquinol 3-O-methyltransferase UbiG [Pseudomonadota bacterium]
MLQKTPNPRNRQDIYDDTAANWWSDDIKWVRTLKNMVPGRLRYFDRFMDWNGAKVLDLGCAGGFMAEAIDERGSTATGIDPSEPAIEAARAHAKSGDRDIDYHVGVGEALPFDSDSFDAVVCVDVLEHVSDLAKVVSEVARVLKPGGKFLFDTINRNPIASLVAVTAAEDILGLLPKGTHDPKMFIKPGELRGHLMTSGFQVGKLTGLGPVGLNRRGDFIFGQLPSTAIIYMGTAQLTSKE